MAKKELITIRLLGVVIAMFGILIMSRADPLDFSTGIASDMLLGILFVCIGVTVAIRGAEIR